MRVRSCMRTDGQLRAYALSAQCECGKRPNASPYFTFVVFVHRNLTLISYISCTDTNNKQTARLVIGYNSTQILQTIVSVLAGQIRQRRCTADHSCTKLRAYKNSQMTFSRSRRGLTVTQAVTSNKYECTMDQELISLRVA